MDIDGRTIDRGVKEQQTRERERERERAEKKRREGGPHQDLVGIHGAGQEEGGIVWRVERIAEDVHRRNALDVVLRAQVGCQEAAKLHQRVVTLEGRREREGEKKKRNKRVNS